MKGIWIPKLSTKHLQVSYMQREIIIYWIKSTKFYGLFVIETIIVLIQPTS